MKKSKEAAVSVADAKREFSDLLGRVAYGRETVLITRRGRPMARLVPVEATAETPLENRGWLDEGDPFFEIVEDIVSARARHKPRISAHPRVRRSGKGRY